MQNETVYLTKENLLVIKKVYLLIDTKVVYENYMQTYPQLIQQKKQYQTRPM